MDQTHLEAAVARYEELIKLYKSALVNFTRNFSKRNSNSSVPDAASVKTVLDLLETRKQLIQHHNILVEGIRFQVQPPSSIVDLHPLPRKIRDLDQRVKKLDQCLNKHTHLIKRVDPAFQFSSFQPRHTALWWVFHRPGASWQKIKEELTWNRLREWMALGCVFMSFSLLTHLGPLLWAGGPAEISALAVVGPGLLSLLSLEKLSRSKEALEKVGLSSGLICLTCVITSGCLGLAFFQKPQIATYFYCWSDLKIKKASSPGIDWTEAFGSTFRSCWENPEATADIASTDEGLIHAEPDLKIAIAFDPNYANARARLGWLYELRQDIDQAKVEYKLALQSKFKRNGKIQDGWLIARIRLSQLILVEAETGSGSPVTIPPQKPLKSDDPNQNTPPDDEKPDNQQDNKNKEDTSKQIKLANTAALIMMQSTSQAKILEGEQEQNRKRLWYDWNLVLGWTRLLQGRNKDAEDNLKIVIDAPQDPSPIAYCLLGRIQEAKLEESESQNSTTSKDKLGKRIKDLEDQNSEPIDKFYTSVRHLRNKLEGSRQLSNLRNLDIQVSTIEAQSQWCTCKRTIQPSPDNDRWVGEAMKKCSKLK
jgi:tetratricopeptide (TPR) repeat protein